MSDLRMDTAGSFFSTCEAISKGPLASLSKAACVALMRPGSSAIGRELLATKAATISAANSIDCEASASDVVMGEFLKGQEEQRYSVTGHWSIAMWRLLVDGRLILKSGKPISLKPNRAKNPLGSLDRSRQSVRFLVHSFGDDRNHLVA